MMTVPDRKLAKGEKRFFAKKIDAAWRVYDKVRQSFPYHNAELGGKVVQDVPEKEAQAEADRLNDLFVEKVVAAEAPKKRARAGKPVPKMAKAESSETVEEPEDTWISEEDIPDYGIMDEETAKKYTEGIL